MNRSVAISEYRTEMQELEKSFTYIKSLYTDDGIDALCKARKNNTQEFRNTLEAMEIGMPDGVDPSMLCKALVSNGKYLLEGRYVIPVRDYAGNLVTLIGYYPDKKKYITAPTLFFSKRDTFFNIDLALELSWREFGGLVVVVEGIFDAISLYSIGLPAVAVQGSTCVEDKECLLNYLFDKVTAIPDSDKIGQKATDRKHGWQLPIDACFVKLVGGYLTRYDEQGNYIDVAVIKDIDDFIKNSEYLGVDFTEKLLDIAESYEDFAIFDFGLDSTEPVDEDGIPLMKRPDKIYEDYESMPELREGDYDYTYSELYDADAVDLEYLELQNTEETEESYDMYAELREYASDEEEDYSLYPELMEEDYSMYAELQSEG